MVSYCSLSNDRSLTKTLIENSNDNSSKSFHRFLNTPDWVDGLDMWSSTKILKKNDISKRCLDFDQDLGLYLPKSDKLNCQAKNDLISSKLTNKNVLPERLRQLIKREENHFEISLSDRSLSLSNDEQLSISEEPQTTNIIQKQCSSETSSSKILRFPLRQVESRNGYRENQIKQRIETINREKFQCLLKEQISNMFNRETTNINSKRTVIKIPAVEIKHQNYPLRTHPQTDPTLIIERYAKLQQLLISPSPNPPTINTKYIDNRQSPFIFQGLSTFGLTVTPLDFSSSKPSPEKISQQEITRPITQPVFLSSSIEQQKTILLKRNLESGLISSSSANIIVSTQNSNDEQTQIMKKASRVPRSLTKNTFQRSKTFQYLPHIYGKRIHANLSNQTDS